MQITGTNRSNAVYKTPNTRKSPSFTAKIYLCNRDEFYKIIGDLSQKGIELFHVEGPPFTMEKAAKFAQAAYTEKSFDCIVSSIFNTKGDVFMSHIMPNRHNMVEQDIYNSAKKLSDESKGNPLEGLIIGGKFIWFSIVLRIARIRDTIIPIHEFGLSNRKHNIDLFKKTLKAFDAIAESFGMDYTVLVNQSKTHQVNVISHNKNHYVFAGNDFEHINSAEKLVNSFKCIKISDKDRIIIKENGKDITEEVKAKVNQRKKTFLEKLLGK